MARASAGTVNPHGRTGVRIVVVGDQGTGKSSLISTAAANNFPVNVPPVLPPTRLPEDLYPDRVPITIIDTSSRIEHSDKVAEELQQADTVVLTYACDRPESLENLSIFWLPHLRKLEVKVPVIVVCCKLDLRDENQQVSLEQVMSPIMQQFPEIETFIECSASRHIQVHTHTAHTEGNWESAPTKTSNVSASSKLSLPNESAPSSLVAETPSPFAMMASCLHGVGTKGEHLDTHLRPSSL